MTTTNGKIDGGDQISKYIDEKKKLEEVQNEEKKVFECEGSCKDMYLESVNYACHKCIKKLQITPTKYQLERIEEILNDHSEPITTQPEKEWEEEIEKLADIEHQRWADWMEYMFDCAIKSGDDNIGIRTLGFPTKQFENWERQIETDYKDLIEKEKQSDRNQVMRYFPIIQSLLSQRDKEVRKEIADKLERTLNESGQVDVVAFIKEIELLKPTK